MMQGDTHNLPQQIRRIEEKRYLLSVDAEWLRLKQDRIESGLERFRRRYPDYEEREGGVR
jgi:hypothetical protein